MIFEHPIVPLASRLMMTDNLRDERDR